MKVRARSEVGSDILDVLSMAVVWAVVLGGGFALLYAVAGAVLG